MNTYFLSVEWIYNEQKTNAVKIYVLHVLHRIHTDLLEDILGIVEFHEVGRTLLEGLNEETLGIVEFHKLGRTLLEGLQKESLGIVKFHEVDRNFFEVLHEIILVVVLCEVGILYLLVHSNLLHIRSLHAVVRKLPQDYV